ncbi:MAG: hypothetical protein ACQR33_05545 [Candidatus Saccharibacteria bacterium]
MDYDQRRVCANCPQVITCAENIDALYEERAVVIDRAFDRTDTQAKLGEMVNQAQTNALMYQNSEDDLARNESRFALVILDRALRGTERQTRGLVQVLQGYDRAIERSFNDIDSLSLACRGLKNCMKGDPRRAWSYRMKNAIQGMFGRRRNGLDDTAS